MYLSKLVTVLKSFDEPRLKRLKKYVHSPYFNTPPVCRLLLDRLLLLHPKFLEKKMTPELLGKGIVTLSTSQKQTTAATQLLTIIKEFIALEEWQKDRARVTQYLLKGLKQLSLAAEFKKEYAKEKELLDTDPEQNFDVFFERHALAELKHTGFSSRLSRNAQNDLLPIVKTLDDFYALKRLRALCEIINRHQVFGAAYHDEHVPGLLKILEPYNSSKYPYPYLFINVYHLLSSSTYEDSRLYYQLIKQFAEERGPTPSLQEAMGYAINRSLDWFNQGHDEAGSEYLWWIDWRMKHNLLLEKGQLMPVTFRNIVSIAVITKVKPDEIEKMINRYAPHLPAEQHDTFLAFARGLHQYRLQRYKEAIRFLLEARAKDEVKFNCLIRRWEWMCLYEYDRNDTDELYNHLLSFEKHLQRNEKELDHVINVFELFISYAMKLLKAVGTDAVSEHMNNLNTQEYFAGKIWLLQHFEAKIKKPVRNLHGPDF